MNLIKKEASLMSYLRNKKIARSSYIDIEKVKSLFSFVRRLLLIRASRTKEGTEEKERPIYIFLKTN